MPLPLTVSCFTKIQIGFTFLVLGHPGSPGQRAVKRVCVCVHGNNAKHKLHRHTKQNNCWYLYAHDQQPRHPAMDLMEVGCHYQLECRQKDAGMSCWGKWSKASGRSWRSTWCTGCTSHRCGCHCHSHSETHQNSSNILSIFLKTIFSALTRIKFSTRRMDGQKDAWLFHKPFYVGSVSNSKILAEKWNNKVGLNMSPTTTTTTTV